MRTASLAWWLPEVAWDQTTLQEDPHLIESCRERKTEEHKILGQAWAWIEMRLLQTIYLSIYLCMRTSFVNTPRSNSLDSLIFHNHWQAYYDFVLRACRADERSTWSSSLDKAEHWRVLCGVLRQGKAHERRDAETRQGIWAAWCWDKARHMRVQEQRDAETKQGTWETKRVCCCDKASDKKQE